MASPTNVVVRGKRRVFDGFFKLDEIVVSHEQFDGSMSPDKSLLVFERGDAVAALIFNRDTSKVVLVEQFKVPTLEKGGSNGWIVETMAGMIRLGETPEQAVKREALEETGYRLQDPEHIATFFSSPGGSSERIFLFYAVVGNADRIGAGGGSKPEGEDIRLLTLTPEELFERLRLAAIDDPKLIISAYHLKDRLRIAPPKDEVLQPGTAVFTWNQDPRFTIGIKTGEVLQATGLDIWVNPENTDMMMDRVIGRTISASIRYGGAEKDDNMNMVEDTIADALREALGSRRRVSIGSVVETTGGALAENGVRRILHVAAAQAAGPGRGVRADLEMVAQCAFAVLEHAHARNEKRGFLRRADRSLLLPILGAGDGGLAVEVVTPRLVQEIVRFFRTYPQTQLTQIYLLAYTARHKAACEEAIAASAFAPPPKIE